MTTRVRDRFATGLLTLLLAWALGWPGRLAALDIPFLAGHVNDQAGLLDLEQGRVIEEKLTAFEERTGHQVVVLTVPSLEGEVLEDFSIKVAETWKLGREEQDDGVLLLIAKDDRKLRIEVGYGLEGQLTDLLAQRILDEKVVPRFKEGDFAAGVDDGVTAILAVID
ncbi:MAG: TPM domain-containing protein, partial [Thermoanaerobaculia bacterium]|nr:TPM domain-containing protein [Thermoanaerobaculia bacterium]